MSTETHVTIDAFRVLGFNFIISFLGAWGVHDVTYKDTIAGGVKVRIYEPKHKPGDKMAAIIYLHGGGWVYGSPDSYHGLTGYLASELRMVVFVIDYRNPPVHLFPTPLDDATNATAWFLKHPDDYDVDPYRIALMGDSCGGNLAAAVAQRLTFQSEYRHLPKLQFQGLIYPVLQAFDFNLPSYQQNGDKASYILRKEPMAEYWSIYMTGDLRLVKYFLNNNHTTAAAKSYYNTSEIISHYALPRRLLYSPYDPTAATRFSNEDVYNDIKATLLNPDFAPLMRENLQGLPPAYVLTAQHDPLRDEGILYAQRLEKAGVDVTWKHYNHGVHGIFSLFPVPGLSVAAGREGMQNFLDYAREKLSLPEKCEEC